MPSDKKPKKDKSAIEFNDTTPDDSQVESIGGVLEAARRKKETTPEYEKQTEPERAERSYNWKTAIGLQQVDGLTPSKYLIDTANANIEGKISLDEAEQFIADYYAHKPDDAAPEERTEEADKVAVRIAKILSGKSFKLSPAQLISIHKQLFDGIYDFAGQIRTYNISKKEWVLKGDSVYYGDFADLKTLLDYDFDREKSFDYGNLEPRAAVEHIAKFIADVWQIHAFGEGNTRTIAVFAIKYLRTFGYEVTNDTFERNSFYFRNALVRSNYNSYTDGVKATPVYLNRFFGNLLFGEQNDLQSRELQINVKPPEAT
ncbi:cell filamentation protein Fic [Clostridia bacterium]|nr:cell filamentation protein Fic [Clostridia bacterium]